MINDFDFRKNVWRTKQKKDEEEGEETGGETEEEEEKGEETEEEEKNVRFKSDSPLFWILIKILEL